MDGSTLPPETRSAALRSIERCSLFGTHKASLAWGACIATRPDAMARSGIFLPKQAASACSHSTTRCKINSKLKSLPAHHSVLDVAAPWAKRRFFRSSQKAANPCIVRYHGIHCLPAVHQTSLVFTTGPHHGNAPVLWRDAPHVRVRFPVCTPRPWLAPCRGAGRSAAGWLCQHPLAALASHQSAPATRAAP